MRYQVWLSVLFMGLVGLQVASALGVAVHPDGLYAFSDDGVFRCRELMSSGSDDEVLMIFFVALAPCIVIRLWNISRKPSGVEIGLYVGILALGLLILIAPIGLECGDVAATLLHHKSPHPIAFALFTLAALIVLFALRWTGRQPAPTQSKPLR